MKILMVCLGNICRSPLAHGLLESKISKFHYVDSAGTYNGHEGELPDKRSIDIAKENHIDIKSQRSRPISKIDLKTFDLIFCMDKSNLETVQELAESKLQLSKIKLILKENSKSNLEEIPDPYFGGKNGFKYVYDLLDNVTDCIVENYQLQKQ